jgi:sulfate adenylyltransferase subunit 2
MTQMLQQDPREAEAIYVIREAAAQFRKPVLLFSGGKDSVVLVHLARKAFYPAPLPFTLVHVETGHDFPETLAFRDRLVARIGARLEKVSVEAAMARGLVADERPGASRNALQGTVLVDWISRNGIDACLGGARRDEEKSRAKERLFSVRNAFGRWDERRQRPELFNLLNGMVRPGENVRVFPISNWTEADVWRYIRREQLELPELYFAHEREVVLRNGQPVPVSPLQPVQPGEQALKARVRFRTVGDMSCSGALFSDAADIDAVIAENQDSSLSERGTRLDDQRDEASLELRKKSGYF